MKRAFSIIGIIVCIAIIFMGINLLSVKIELESAAFALFGADFYTEIYSATRYAANNIKTLAEFIYTVMAYLMISVGSIGFCFFCVKLGETKKDSLVVEIAEQSKQFNRQILEKADQILQQNHESEPQETETSFKDLPSI